MDRGNWAELIVSQADEIIDLWLQGKSLRQAAEELFLPGDRVYSLLRTNEVFRSKYLAAREVKGAMLADRAMEWAEEAGSKGVAMLDSALINTGVSNHFKAASKLDPTNWGDKTQLQLSGQVKVEQDLTVSPAEAYERMIGK